MNIELRKEWEEDERTEHRDPRRDTWLQTLSKRRWDLRTANTGRIKLDPQIMNNRDVEGGYVFQESLGKRSQELKETVERFAAMIWPLIIKEEGFMLADGYCRFSILEALNHKERTRMWDLWASLVPRAPNDSLT